MSTRTFIYDRIQKDAADDTATELARREKDLRDYAEQSDMEVVGVSHDTASANDEERPGLRQMMDAAERGEFDVLLVNDLDRLTRELPLMMIFFNALSKYSIELHTPRGRMFPVAESS